MLSDAFLVLNTLLANNYETRPTNRALPFNFTNKTSTDTSIQRYQSRYIFCIVLLRIINFSLKCSL